MKSTLIALIALGLVCGAFANPDAAIAKGKKWTITERQEELSKQVDKGEKSNELTKKEADKLREKLLDVNSRIDKMKLKNGGKLSYKDEGKIEKELNDISIDIQKKELDKRVTAH
ncbi:MAG: hypothetical protein K2X27_10805 [Candidatus Obscuribacterales bacterium]|nr:hypothetical protein [Candidatus Obscuribacterales bacterium]